MSKQTDVQTNKQTGNQNKEREGSWLLRKCEGSTSKQANNRQRNEQANKKMVLSSKQANRQENRETKKKT